MKIKRITKSTNFKAEIYDLVTELSIAEGRSISNMVETLVIESLKKRGLY